MARLVEAGGYGTSGLIATFACAPAVERACAPEVERACAPDVKRDANVKFDPLEHFAMKWKPVNRNKMRLNKGIEHGFDSIKTKTGSRHMPKRDDRAQAIISGQSWSSKMRISSLMSNLRFFSLARRN